ncbi:MAG: hypothetical protein JRN35_05820 [Nitrososphaerota archaeon]|nr:hypothetical protein [Nitrososphaerota archaeon]
MKGLYNPDNFTTGGLPVNNAELEWANVGFVKFNYDGSSPETVALHVDYKVGGEVYPQHYSVGDPKRWNIVDGGRNIEPVEEGESIRKSSNCGQLLAALVNSGVPQNILADAAGIDVLNGLVTYNVGQPRTDLNGKPVVDEQGRPKTMSLPTRVVSAPWDKKGGKSKKSATGSATSADLDPAIIAFLEAQLAANNGEVERKDLATALYSDKKLAPNAATYAGVLFSPDGVAKLAAKGFVLDGETFSKAG